MQQMCDKCQSVQEATEVYAIKRPGCDILDQNLERSAKAMLAARVTQLEMVLMRIVEKSKHPAARIASQCSCFDSEDLFNKATAEQSLGIGVKTFLRNKYNMFKEGDVAVAPAVGGA